MTAHEEVSPTAVLEVGPPQVEHEGAAAVKSEAVLVGAQRAHSMTHVHVYPNTRSLYCMAECIRVNTYMQQNILLVCTHTSTYMRERVHMCMDVCTKTYV